MPTPSISDYLKYANLQMAAEAFLVYDEGENKGRVKDNIELALTDGNNHASFFTESEATKFNNEWQVVAQCPNTKTGFSGTLFNNQKGSETFAF